jgi:fumarate hydratase subunit beta
MEVKLKTPLLRRDTEELKVKDTVYISGTIYTARDSAHQRMIEEGSPVNLDGAVIFHAGPIIRTLKNPDGSTGYQMVAVGPTTSTRMNPYEPTLIDSGVKAVIGKGGMDQETSQALMRNGAVFLAAVGGCAALYVKSIIRIKNVYWMDLGIPEAIWELEVKDFGPLFVTMDAHGGNLYEQIKTRISSERIHR